MAVVGWVSWGGEAAPGGKAEDMTEQQIPAEVAASQARDEARTDELWALEVAAREAEAAGERVYDLDDDDDMRDLADEADDELAEFDELADEFYDGAPWGEQQREVDWLESRFDYPPDVDYDYGPDDAW